MKLSKQQIKAHEQCLTILEKDALTYDEKIFVYENWYPAYGNQIGKIASFFTPVGLANDFQLAVGGDSIVDLCAGIGMLSFLHYHRMSSFISVGEKLFPEATWIQGDVLNETLIKSLGRFSMAISNPPFGNIKSDTSSKWLKYKGSDFEYKVIEIAGYLADNASFIIPQGSCPFRYSGGRGYERISSNKYEKFNSETGIVFDAAIGIDCAMYKDDWKGASPMVEVVDVSEYPVEEVKIVVPSVAKTANNPIQTELF